MISPSKPSLFIPYQGYPFIQPELKQQPEEKINNNQSKTKGIYIPCISPTQTQMTHITHRLILYYAADCYIQPMIVDENNYDNRFTADKVIQDGGKDIFGVNYWLTPDRKGGYFVMDLGCDEIISKLTVRNTHNDDHHDRGTNQISVYVSNSASGPWANILTTNLPDPRNTDPPKETFKVTGQGRYVKVEVDSYYENGGGLQFFGVNSEGNFL